jgi:hypothetical protein
METHLALPQERAVRWGVLAAARRELHGEIAGLSAQLVLQRKNVRKINSLDFGGILRSPNDKTLQRYLPFSISPTIYISESSATNWAGAG